MSAPANSFERQPQQSGGRESALDVVSLSGGLSKRWPLPDALFGRLSGSSQKREASSKSGDLKMEGSVSSFLDVKMGCMFGGGAVPQPFAQEVKKIEVFVRVACGNMFGFYRAGCLARFLFSNVLCRCVFVIRCCLLDGDFWRSARHAKECSMPSRLGEDNACQTRINLLFFLSFWGRHPLSINYSYCFECFPSLEWCPQIIPLIEYPANCRISPWSSNRSRRVIIAGILHPGNL